jgi:Icc protein
MQDFSFIQVTDHHLGDHPCHLRYGYATNYAFDLTLRHIAAGGYNSDFLLSTGDLVDPPTPSGYSYLRSLLGITGSSPAPGPLYVNIPGMPNQPFYCIPGNHDDRNAMGQVLFAAQAFPSFNVAFIHKGVHFICVDWGSAAQAHTSQDMLDFLRRSLALDLPALIISHHAVVPVGTHWLDQFVAKDIDRFWKIVTQPSVNSRILGILSGHTHLTYDQQVENIPVLGLRSTCYSFAQSESVQMVITNPHYRLVTIRDGVLSSRIVEVPLPIASRIDID